MNVVNAPDASLIFRDQLKKVLRFMPAPVGIVTSFEPESGSPVGLAMSAIMPVSLDPPSMAICVNRSGSSYDALVRAGRFCINLLHADNADRLSPFASSSGRDQRFSDVSWREKDKVWYIDGAPANIFCNVRDGLHFGTHHVLIGEVYDLASSGDEDILGWANGALGHISPLAG